MGHQNATFSHLDACLDTFSNLCLLIWQKIVHLLIREANLMFRVKFEPLFMETGPKRDIIFEYQFYKSNPVSISLYTTFTVLPLSVIFSKTFSLFPNVHQESPTYNCPCEKTGDLKSNPTCANDCP